ncbi:MAG: chitobiase/beta-hexosaminidase C-terminal domain-containing protein [Cyanobacteria bacterium]|nr:chitobiase/beta-hexosaminidase C-terminal domain-containing protein [Cyanobacteriota bacterium]
MNFVAPATAGGYEIRFFAHGGFGRLTTATINVSSSTAALTVDDTPPPTAVSVAAGTYVSVRVSGGPAQPGDWVGLFAANAADSAHLAWRYLNGTTTLPANGQSDAQLMFAVPVTAGSYEFRFFNANTLTRLATSTSMVVSASSAALSVNGVAAPAAVTLAAGSQTVVSVTGGPANVGDWVGLFEVNAPDTAILDWRYLDDTAQLPATGVSASTLHFGVPATAGTYEFRFFADGGGVLSTSGNVIVPQTVAQITVNGLVPPTSVSAAPASTLSVEITGGPANPTDWVALATQGAPNSSFVAWQYLSGSSNPPATGLSSATLSFVLPTEAGAYELRLFAHNSYERITTSSTVVAGAGPAETTIRIVSPFPGTTFNSPASLLLSASTSITGGTINRVDFYTGAALIGTASAPPYTAEWINPPAGSHILTAAAIDSSNGVTTSSPVAITIAAAGSNNGTLGSPIADPAGGVFGAGQPVTLTAAPGAIVHYTIDGSNPDENSTIYAGPLTLSESTILRARAYQTDWTASEIASASYQIDTTPPTIFATVTPPPNPAGWNNTPVTVSFECFDNSLVAACPAPVELAEDGADQLVMVTAVDGVGLNRHLTVTVNIDSEPPLVSLIAPSADVSTTNDILAVNAAANDAGSGVWKAVCAGQAQIPDGNAVNCAVTLTPGQNTIILAAVDLAGNSASASFLATRITTPTGLSLTPTKVTLAVGDAKVLTVTTDLGLPATEVTWTSSDPTVVAIGADNDGTISAEALGEATITATAGNLNAQTIVRVLPAITLGEAIWTTAPGPGRYVVASMRANRVLDSDADLFNVEADLNGSNTSYTVKAIRGVDGATLWSESVGDRPVPDAFGGFIVKGEGGPMMVNPFAPASTLRRLGLVPEQSFYRKDRTENSWHEIRARGKLNGKRRSQVSLFRVFTAAASSC